MALRSARLVPSPLALLLSCTRPSPTTAERSSSRLDGPKRTRATASGLAALLSLAPGDDEPLLLTVAPSPTCVGAVEDEVALRRGQGCGAE